MQLNPCLEKNIILTLEKESRLFIIRRGKKTGEREDVGKMRIGVKAATRERDPLTK